MSQMFYLGPSSINLCLKTGKNIRFLQSQISRFDKIKTKMFTQNLRHLVHDYICKP